jgi:hypothetical protein
MRPQFIETRNRVFRGASWIFNRLSHLNLNHNPLANYFQHLAHSDTPKAKAILVEADQVADALGLDDEGLDGAYRLAIDDGGRGRALLAGGSTDALSQDVVDALPVTVAIASRCGPHI